MYYLIIAKEMVK